MSSILSDQLTGWTATSESNDMAKYLSRLLPIEILLLIVFAGWVPSIVESLKPGTYWIQLWVPNVERYLQPIVFVTFVITLVIYLIYRVWRILRHKAVVEVLSERDRVIFFFIDITLYILAPLILCYII